MEKLLIPVVGALLVLGACSSDDSAAVATTTTSEAPATTSETPAETSTVTAAEAAADDEVGVSVNGAELTVAEFNDQLEAWASLAEDRGQPVRTGDTYDPLFVGAITDQYIRFEAFLDHLDATGVESTAQDRAQAEAAAAVDFADVATDDPARTLATQWLAGLAAVEPGADELDAYVAANVDELTAKAVCSSHILVDTSDEAEAVAERLAAGESFADVAREVSIDTGSGAAGGDLGCVALGTFVPEYETAALQAELGVVTEPVQSEFGFHLILTREATADELLPIASATINEQTQATMDTAIEEATVVLAPQFGTWDAAAHLYSPPPA